MEQAWNQHEAIQAAVVLDLISGGISEERIALAAKALAALRLGWHDGGYSAESASRFCK